MLCQFTYKNFKSYRDETVFDLQATSVSEHSGSLLTSDKDNRAFLPVSVIYGPNAGGKSGILEALAALVSHIMMPIEYIKQVPGTYMSMRHIEYFPFLFDESSKNAPTEFAVYFRRNGSEFRYTLSVLKGHIISESLFRKNIGGKNPAKIFVRDTSGVHLGASLSKRTINIDVNPKIPYLSFLAINHDFDVIQTVVEWFSKCICVNYTSSYMSSIFTPSPSEKKILLEMFREIDIPITDYYIDTYKDEKSGKELLDTVRIEREIDGNSYSLDILYESRGTIKLFYLLPLVLASLAEGCLFVADELDASLHPKLLRYIVKLFKDKSINKKNAQLVFTSHDIATMKNDLFRRDEIWFAVKDDKGASEIYSLYEIRNEDGSHVKSTAPFDKQYLDGRYGADPYLSEMLSLKWED